MSNQLLTVQGVYDGKAIKPLARLKTNKKQRVLIIFLDAIEAPAERKKTSATQRRKPTARAKNTSLIAEREDWRQLALHSLERAYGDDEPEYSSALIKERNLEYERR